MVGWCWGVVLTGIRGRCFTQDVMTYQRKMEAVWFCNSVPTAIVLVSALQAMDRIGDSLASRALSSATASSS